MSCPPLTNKGGKLSISRFPVPCELTLPELAQLDYVVVPGVGSIGDTGIEQEISSYSTTNAGLSPQSKGAAVGKAWDVEMLESQSEARDILEAASAAGNKDTYATRIEWPDGVVEYSIVQVSSPTYVKGAPSGVRIVRYTMVPSIVPIVKNALQAPALYAPMYDAPDTVELNWFDLSSIEDGVHVYASYSKIDVNALPPPTATLASNTVQYDYAFDMGEVLEERLYFRVAAFKSGIVKVSNEQSIGNPANVLYPGSPTWLFGDGESGYANTLGLDTLFTDTDGTTPVEEYGDAIALATNLADDGPDMEQATAAERPVWGRMPVSGVRNQLINSEDISGAGWTGAGVTASDFETLITNVGAATNSSYQRTGSILKAAAPQVWSFQLEAEAAGFDSVSMFINDAASVSNRATVIVNLTDGTISNIATSGAFTNAAADVVPLGGGRFWISLTCTTSTETQLQCRVYPRDSVATSGNGVDGIKVTKMQLEPGLPTDYQKVTAPYDVTEPGTPSVNIAYSDTSDDNWSWNLAAGTYHVFIAGEKGCLFAESTHAGGEFSIGPTTWPDGPAGGIQTYIGQRYVIVPVILDRAFSDFEKAQLVAYAVARGCPGEVTP